MLSHPSLSGAWGDSTAPKIGWKPFWTLALSLYNRPAPSNNPAAAAAKPPIAWAYATAKAGTPGTSPAFTLAISWPVKAAIPWYCCVKPPVTTACNAALFKTSAEIVEDNAPGTSVFIAPIVGPTFVVFVNPFLL